jgi:ubiquinone/menaquinone biosynthesis C-methylase UbiE
MPDYYRRNFHHQTDGYLSERSADLYDHQVELLFRGGADAMRRLILPPLKSRLGSEDGQGLHLLELGAGCGTATRSVAKAFPAAKITCVDFSYPYIKRARRELADHHRVDFVQGDAAALDFREDRFDAVYSVFLFHELPPDVRVRVLQESLRVVKPQGFLGLVDSIQKGDDEDLDWALDFFPRQFHEPYYASYTAHPMETLMKEAGVESVESATGYLAKVVWGTSPAEQRRPSREQQEG